MMSISALRPFDRPRHWQDLADRSAHRHAQHASVSAAGVSVSSEVGGSLTIVTAEGDKISLSASVAAEFQAASYQRSGRAETGTTLVSGSSQTFSMSRQVAVSVEGDLNAQELKEVVGLVRKMSNAFNKFVQGNDRAGAAQLGALASQFAHSSSLASVDLSVDVARRMTSIGVGVRSAAGEITSRIA